MRWIIKVTQADINEGLRGSCVSCPLARAAVRKLNSPVMIGDRLIVCWGGQRHKAEEFRLPPVAINFIDDFDHGRPVAPFKFQLGHEYEL